MVIPLIICVHLSSFVVSPFASLQMKKVPPLIKLVLSFDMLVGRLEIFPMLVLFAPSTWLRSKGHLDRRLRACNLF